MGPAGIRRLHICSDCVAQEEAEKAASRRGTWEEDGRLVRRCGECTEVKDLLTGFPRHRRPESVSQIQDAYRYLCTPCWAAYRRAYRAMRTQDPEYLERKRAQNRAWARKARRENPEREREVRRAFRERLKQDPKRLEHRRETMRMTERLRKMRAGQEVREAAIQEPPGPRLPSMQLGAVIEARSRRLLMSLDTESDSEGAVRRVLEAAFPHGIGESSGDDDVIEAVGRAYRAWRTGERQTVSFRTADIALTNLGLEWWDVWNEDTVRLWRWRFDRYVVRDKKAHGQVKARFIRMGCVFSGDLGTDHETLNRIEWIFTDPEALAA